MSEGFSLIPWVDCYVPWTPLSQQSLEIPQGRQVAKILASSEASAKVSNDSPFSCVLPSRKFFPLCWAILTTEISVFPPGRNNGSAAKSCKAWLIVDTRQIWVVRYTSWHVFFSREITSGLHYIELDWAQQPIYLSVEEYLGEKKPDHKGLELITLVIELLLSMLLEIIRGETWGEGQGSKMTTTSIIFFV